MPESILAKYVDSEPVPSQRGIRCLNLVTKDGNSFAISYNHFLWANYNPSLGLQVHFSTHTITIVGRNLGPLYEAVVRFELSEVVEVGEKRTLAGRDETVVTRLYIMQKPEGIPASFEMPGEAVSGAPTVSGVKKPS